MHPNGTRLYVDRDNSNGMHVIDTGTDTIINTIAFSDGCGFVDSTGLAIQDLAIAKAALAKADELDLPRFSL